jgi:competence protein ComEA
LVATIGDMQPIVLSRRSVLLGGLALVLVLLLGGRFLLHARHEAASPVAGRGSGGASSQGELVARAHAASAAKLVVYVVGAVRRPGLYHLSEGARIADAIARAGGATKRADAAAVNLAAPVADGEQVLVPARLPRAVAIAQGVPTPGAPPGPVQLSAATTDQLDALPGIGPTTAQKIVDYRAEHGPFRSVDELDEVPGIGPAKVEQLRDLVIP